MPGKIWHWAPLARRYRDPATGRFVSRETIRRGVDDLILRSQRNVTSFTDSLRLGNIDLATWQRGMQDEIKRTQLGAQALLRGGWAQLTDVDLEAINVRIREQFEFLHKFTADLRAGRVRTDGEFMNRARLYPAAARVGYHQEESELMLTSGYRDELNVMHPAEHCADCKAAEARGWVPIKTNPPIGTRRCLGNDRCTMLYR